MTATTPAAYGVRLRGLADHRWLAVSGAESWPALHCATTADPGAPEAVLSHDGVRLSIRSDVAHAEVIHPLLGRITSALALARGGDAMHAGAIAGAGGAWAVIGPKMAGKSTLLAALADAGTPIVTDDVLVFADGRALAGPRCIDLRPDAPRRGPGAAVRPTDPRHRVALAPIAAEHPLAGVIHLRWSTGDCTVTRVGHREAITRLLAVREEKGWPRHPGALLALAALPTVCLHRPRTPAGLDASVALVQETVADPARKIDAPALVAWAS